MRIIGVYGSKKSSRESVLVHISIDGTEINERNARQDFDGRVVYASNPAWRGYEHWWVVSVEVPEGAIIRLETKVGVFNKGRDTDRTVTHHYEATEDAQILEVRIPKVGPKKYPLLKGRLKRVSQICEQDKIDQEVEGLFSEVDE